MYCRGVRGATTADENTPEAILRATRELLALMIRQNDIAVEDVAYTMFSMTSDLDAEFPALAARQLGWYDTPLFCVRELEIVGSLKSCIRILIHLNTNKSADEIFHVYVKDAIRLRPDLQELPPVDWDELDQWIRSHTCENAPSSVIRDGEKG